MFSVILGSCLGQHSQPEPTGVEEPVGSDTEAGHFPASLLYAAAKLYYTEDATQADVAAQLGTSRATVSRLLAEAKRRGIVRIEVVPPTEVATGDLADRLTRALSLATVYPQPSAAESGPRPNDRRRDGRRAGPRGRQSIVRGGLARR